MQLRSDFAAACAILGLSAPMVAEMLDVRHDTARAWIGGRRNPPPAAWDALAEMYQAQWGGPDGDPAPAEAMVRRALRRLRAA